MLVRLGFALLSLAILQWGVLAVLKSPILGYTNYWGGYVFGPFAIVIGILLFVVLVLNPEKIGRRVDGRKRRG